MLDASVRLEARVNICGPIVLTLHPHAPDEPAAAREVEAMTHLFTHGGGRALLLRVDNPVPPPELAALRHYRRLIKEVPQLEYVAILFNTKLGFAQTIGASFSIQFFRLTRLGGAVRIFSELVDAIIWLQQRLDVDLDEPRIAETFEAQEQR